MNVLIALALLVQETPEDVFKKIEAAVEKARIVKVEFTIDAADEKSVPGRGFLSLEEGGRARLSAELKSKNSPTLMLTMECDGQKIVSSLEQSRIEVPYDQKLGRSNFNMYLTRLGVFTGALFQHAFWIGSSRGREAILLDLKQVLQVQNVQSGGEGKGGTKILTYDFKSAFEPMPLEKAKIWYDPKTYTIVRREYRLKDKRRAETLYEEYSDWNFGEEKTATGGTGKPPPPPPIPDSELDTLFFKAKLQVAESHVKAGKKDKAIEVLEDAIKTYPKHSLVSEARRLLEEAKKK